MGTDADSARVAHVLISLVHGGLERCVLEWVQARETQCPGTTFVICLDQAGEWGARVPGDRCVALEAERSRRPWDRRAVQRLRDQLRIWRIDVVHSHNVAAQQYAGLAARGVCAHVHTEHGSNLHTNGIVNRMRLMLLKASTDVWVAVSPHTQAAMAAATGIGCRCIENGIVVEPVGVAREEARRRLGVDGRDGVLLGVVGRLSHEKGVDRLLDLLDAPEWGSDVHLAVVGDGPEREALEARAAAYGDRVRFCGARDDARECLPAFDLLVLPSRSEGLPMVLLEAMAEGVPVAVADAGSCAGVVAGGCGSILPADPARWPASLARTIAQIHSGELAGQISAARVRVRERYSVRRTADAYEAIYAEVLACSPS